jgi:hypothetical protein
MDCERFDRVALDLVYAELDELTSAAAKRHLGHCARCRDVSTRLRATREIAVLPLVEPPSGLRAKILAAERQARSHLGARQRLGRVVSVLAGYAMRPQTAMAALLMIMIGASLMFLRARPGERDHVRVTERGVPEGEGEPVTVVPVPERAPHSDTRTAPPHETAEIDPGRERARATGGEKIAAAQPTARPESQAGRAAPLDKSESESTSADYGTALQAYRNQRYAQAQRDFELIAAQGGAEAPSAALWAAKSMLRSQGCPSAVARFDELQSRYAASDIGNQAAWEAANCYQALGQSERARKSYLQLREASGYSERAQRALDSMAHEVAGSADVAAGASKPAAAAPPPAKAQAPAAAEK